MIERIIEDIVHCDLRNLRIGEVAESMYRRQLIRYGLPIILELATPESIHTNITEQANQLSEPQSS